MQTILLAILIVGSSILISVAGLLLVRKLIPPAALRRHHDVAGFLIAIVGLIYGVLQAFVVFVVWTQFEDAKSAVETEANCVADVYHLAHAFPASTEARIRGDVRVYVNDVIGKEWPAMARGESSPAAEQSLDHLWVTITTVSPSTARESSIYQEMVTRLNDMGNSRRQRLLASRDGVPSILWFVLIFGGIATVGFTYFFGAESSRAQAGMTALLAAEIAVVLFLIAALDYPFTGDVRISPDSYLRISSRFAAIDTHEQERPNTLQHPR